MPSTHLCLHYHLVFGTKDHVPVIRPSLGLMSSSVYIPAASTIG